MSEALSVQSLWMFASQIPVFNVFRADGSRNPETQKCFTSHIDSLAEIASTGSLRRSTIYELPRLTAKYIKIYIPNAVVHSIKKKG